MQPKPKCERHCFANVIFKNYCDCLVDVSTEYQEHCKFFKDRDEFRRDELIDYEQRHRKSSKALRNQLNGVH